MLLDDFLALRHESSRAKWRKELFREQPPPFLGPLVSIKEAAELLNRSIVYVRARIDDGRLNIWKDTTSNRVWILKDDVDLLLADNRVLEEKDGRSRSHKRGPRKPKIQESHPESASESEDEFEDLDAIGGWEHPKPPPVIPGAGIEESIRESNERYEQKVCESEEWYAAELAKLEDRDPEEAVRQLRIKRGWITPESTDSAQIESAYTDPVPSEPTLADLVGKYGKRRKTPKQRPKPISWSHPNPEPKPPVEPYDDPDFATPSFDNPVIPPFPIGWVDYRKAMAMLQLSEPQFHKLAKAGKFARRKSHGPRPHWLYDSLELERFAEERLSKSCAAQPNKRLDWWGSRSKPMELHEFDGWLTAQEAANMLGVTVHRIGRMCDQGLLPCRQQHPGKQGSKLYVPHHHVLRLAERPDYKLRKERFEKSRATTAAWVEMEEWGIEEHDPRGESKSTRINHGDYLSTRQVALLLGVCQPTVHKLRVRGRLQGHHLHKKKPGTSKNPYWFYKRSDVDALLADPQYRRYSRNGKAAQYTNRSVP